MHRLYLPEFTTQGFEQVENTCGVIMNSPKIIPKLEGFMARSRKSMRHGRHGLFVVADLGFLLD